MDLNNRKRKNYNYPPSPNYFNEKNCIILIYITCYQKKRFEFIANGLIS